jgi:hypothetical protein
MAFVPSQRIVRRAMFVSASDNDFDGFSSKVSGNGE